MSHYTFCPKCGVRHGTTPAQAAANGIECGACGEKFFPQRVERESDSGGFLSFGGLLLIVAGGVACVASLFGSPEELAAIGAGVMSSGVSLIVAAQLFHIRSAVEKLNSKK